MATKAELSKLSVDELEKEVVRLDKEIARLRDEKVKAARAMEAKVEEERAAKVVEGMSDSQRAALAQAIKVAPIADESAVGTPGNE